MVWTLFLYIVTSLSQVNSLAIFVNNTEASDGRYSYIACVKLEDNDLCHCGGFLLSLEYTITACACLYTLVIPRYFLNNDDLKVYAGTINPTQDTPWRQSIKLIPHPNCSLHQSALVKGSYNYGVIKTMPFFKGKQHGYQISTAIIPHFDIFKTKINEMVKKNTNCVEVGWGSIDEKRNSNIISENLRKENMLLMDYKSCEVKHLGTNYTTYFNILKYKRFEERGILCTEAKTQRSCKGHGGGPLICNGYIVALVSEGNNCWLYNSPLLFSRIDFAGDFLKSFIPDLKASSRRSTDLNHFFVQIIFARIILQI